MQRTITLSGVIWDDIEDDGAPGNLEISEDELAGVTDEQLAEWQISRPTLHRCFAEGVELMKDYTERDQMRPIAEHTGDGDDDWQVVIVGYSGLSEPLMQDEPKGSA
jgi:hypothetical protein